MVWAAGVRAGVRALGGCRCGGPECRAGSGRDAGASRALPASEDRHSVVTSPVRFSPPAPLPLLSRHYSEDMVQVVPAG